MTLVDFGFYNKMNIEKKIRREILDSNIDVGISLATLYRLMRSKKEDIEKNGIEWFLLYLKDRKKAKNEVSLANEILKTARKSFKKVK